MGGGAPEGALRGSAQARRTDASAPRWVRWSRQCALASARGWRRATPHPASP